jgi:hypothetical protein
VPGAASVSRVALAASAALALRPSAAGLAVLLRRHVYGPAVRAALASPWRLRRVGLARLRPWVWPLARLDEGRSLRSRGAHRATPLLSGALRALVLAGAPLYNQSCATGGLRLGLARRRPSGAEAGVQVAGGDLAAGAWATSRAASPGMHGVRCAHQVDGHRGLAAPRAERLSSGGPLAWWTSVAVTPRARGLARGAPDEVGAWAGV